MQEERSEFTVIYFSEGAKNMDTHSWQEIRIVNRTLTQDEYIHLFEGIGAEKLILVDGEQMSLEAVQALLRQNRQQLSGDGIGYLSTVKPKCWLNSIQNLWHADHSIISSPILVGTKSLFQKAYGGSDLIDSTVAAIGYSLQKVGGIKFYSLSCKEIFKAQEREEVPTWRLWYNYSIRIPFLNLLSGQFVTHLFQTNYKVQRDMVFRLFFLLFSCFAFIFMPYISKDFGVSGDEFVDHRHAGYVLDYFAKGDKAALDQPKTALHLYGNSVQVITAALCRWFEVDNYYELRHFVGGLIGALGVLATGWLGLRWGGGLCGLLCLLLMFFTPRFLGHSMNNLKDVPFAVGYMLSLFYTVRLFDYYPYFRLRHILGLILGIALALGTRSGGLILYPMLLMYAGLFYINQQGIRNFYKINKNAKEIGMILRIIVIVIVFSYVLAILLWPFALKSPLSRVVYSLVKFTNYGIGLRTIFDGEQVMSNMLPWRYAPQYLFIGMPIVSLIGFFCYWIYMVVRKKEFSLISFFLLFAAIFPVFWVIYCKSNLYGGIRHLLFVMPPLVVLAGRFWSEIISWGKKYIKLLLALIFMGLLALPVFHTIKNHPNEYVYFNEFVGGPKKVYGDYDMDYYFNSLKASADWFRKEILPTLPKDKKTIVATQAADIIKYYFRKDTNIKVVYSRYYEKYSKDWDYAIFGNVYVSPHQLKNGLFPPEGALYTPTVDGLPLSFVMKRETKAELEGFKLGEAGEYEKAIQIFKEYLKDHPNNEEVQSRLGKLYYLASKNVEAKEALERALQLHPALNEAMYVLTSTCIELEDYDRASEIVDRMLYENEYSVDSWYLRALICYYRAQYREAIAALNSLLKLRPNYEKAHLLAGDIFKDNGDFRQAEEMYKVALQMKNSVQTATKLAEVWVYMKKYKELEELLKQLQSFESVYPPINLVKGRMFLQQGKLQEVQKVLEGLRDIQDNADLFVLRAQYAFSKQDIPSCKQMLEEALKLEPKNREALQMIKKIEN